MFYIHNVPGRVRIISDVIKRNLQCKLPMKFRKLLSTLAGVCTAQVNLTTGSILIHYNQKEVKGRDIVDLLERKGYFERNKTISNDEYFRNGLSKAGTTVVKTVIGTFMGTAIGNTPLSFLLFLI